MINFIRVIFLKGEEKVEALKFLDSNLLNANQYLETSFNLTKQEWRYCNKIDIIKFQLWYWQTCNTLKIFASAILYGLLYFLL